MRIGAFLFLSLFAAAVFSAAMHIRSYRREQRMETVLDDVYNVLCVWARTWPDLTVRKQLMKVLRLEV